MEKIYKVSPVDYYILIKRLAGGVFHRIDEHGNHLIKPYFKHYQHIVAGVALTNQ